MQPAPAHARVFAVLTSFPLLPNSTQQVTTTVCLLILVSLRQCCPASHNSLINYCPREHQGLLSVLRASLFAVAVKCKATLTPFTHWTDPMQAGCMKRHLFTPLQLLREKESVPISQRAWRADIQKDQGWWIFLVTQRE